MNTKADASPHPLPSLPPSPVEEDISRAGTWPEDTSTLTDKPPKAKGKERERLDTPSLPYAAEESGFSSDEGETGVEGYPPTKDEKAQARRVEENLRRWELQERQRRKAARESTMSSPTRTSFMADMTQQASLLWSARRSIRPPTGGGGSHHVLRPAEDGVPLDEIDTPAPSRRASSEPAVNPFITPAASTVSLNEPYQSAIMTASSSLPSSEEASTSTLTTPTASRPMLPASLPSHPPPQPLDLPKPRTPPPRTGTPHANKPPEPMPPPTLNVTLDEENVPAGKTRWWTDWLCGCMDTGDHQAARTNPFE
ncbi:unnamed protein product [Somion occarium]|uniref:Uncharacterized protein n=1 Tax=Somion occarium TaxID=3059160 RepID=A0ABP1DK91_9APHY